MWKYDSPIGTFYIKRLSNGRYGLIYQDTLWESSISPEAETDNVYNHQTGCHEWDALDGSIADVPSALDEWTRI